MLKQVLRELRLFKKNEIKMLDRSVHARSSKEIPLQIGNIVARTTRVPASISPSNSAGNRSGSWQRSRAWLVAFDAYRLPARSVVHYCELQSRVRDNGNNVSRRWRSQKERGGARGSRRHVRIRECSREHSEKERERERSWLDRGEKKGEGGRGEGCREDEGETKREERRWTRGNRSNI